MLYKSSSFYSKVNSTYLTIPVLTVLTSVNNPSPKSCLFPDPASWHFYLALKTRAPPNRSVSVGHDGAIPSGFPKFYPGPG